MAAAVGSSLAWQVAFGIAGQRWYAGLLKPTFSPPPWLAVAGACAVSLCLARGLSRVLASPDYLPDRPTALRLFLVGLALDALWSFLFFAGRHPTAALAVAAALAVVSASTARHFAIVDRRAGLLLLPWVGDAAFAFLLDLSIALRNG